MDTSIFLKSIIDSDPAPIVVCDVNHRVVYMNPSSIARYKCDFTGKNIKLCHNAESSEKIDRVVEWFLQSPNNNSVYTYRNEKENKDVYMIALRDSEGALIGYYEKHVYRTPETDQLYDLR